MSDGHPPVLFLNTAYLPENVRQHKRLSEKYISLFGIFVESSLYLRMYNIYRSPFYCDISQYEESPRRNLQKLKYACSLTLCR